MDTQPHTSELLKALDITSSDLAMNRAGNVSPHQQAQLTSLFATHRKKGVMVIMLFLVVAIITLGVAFAVSDSILMAFLLVVSALAIGISGYMIKSLYAVKIAVEKLELHSTKGHLSTQGDGYGNRWLKIESIKLLPASSDLYKVIAKDQAYQVYYVGQWIIAIEAI